MTNIKITLTKVIAGCAVAMAAIIPVSSFAASMNVGKNVSIQGTGVVQGNAYAVGGMVTASGVINGDLLAAGGTVFSSANVNGDIMVGGGTITMVGITAQDVRILGGNVTLGGVLKGELAALAGTLIVTPETTIAKDSYIAGGTVNFSGNEAGNLTLAGSNIYFDGTTKGNLTITHAVKVDIGPHAVIKGAFEYSAPEVATIESGAVISGTPVFHQIQDAGKKNEGFSGVMLNIFTFWFLIKIFTILVAAYLLWYLFRKDTLAVLSRARSHYGKSLLHGFIFFFIVPISVIIAFITVIAAIPGLIALFVYIALLVLAAPFAILFAAMLLQRGSADLRWYYILLAGVVFALVGFIPFVGWIACALVYLVGLGALINVLKEKLA
jgi:hypothetical protein